MSRFGRNLFKSANLFKVGHSDFRVPLNKELKCVKTYSLVLLFTRYFGEEVAMPAMSEFDDQTIRVLKQVIHRHIVQCAYRVIFSLKYQKWYVDT